MDLKALCLIAVAILYGVVAVIEVVNGRASWGMVFGCCCIAGVATFVANKSYV